MRTWSIDGACADIAGGGGAEGAGRERIRCAIIRLTGAVARRSS
ncbi:MAG: hypothetical protein U1F25_18310 [Rubrivivax sp.]